MAKKIRRVCMLNPQGYVSNPPPLGKTDTGGQTLYVLQLAKALAKKNIRVDIITRQFDQLPQGEEVAERVKIVRIPCGPETFLEKEKMYECVPEFVKNFQEYIDKRRIKYDLAHSHYWDGGLAGIKLARKLKIPHVHTPHSLGKLKQIEMNVEGLPPPKLRSAYRYQVRIASEQRILSSVDAAVVICQTNRIQLLQYYVVDFEKLHVIYPGVETDVFRSKPAKTDEPLKKNAILTMSRMVPAKGLDRVIDALAQIKRVPFHLYMGGSVHDIHQSEEERLTEIELKKRIRRHKLEKRVTFLGNVPHGRKLAGYYRSAEVFILAGRYEPFGLTTLEAMACGTPTIVSSVAGSREIVVDELNGFIVDTHDRKALAGSIVDLLKHPRKRVKVGDNAAYTVNKHYSWDHIADQFVMLYEGLV